MKNTTIFMIFAFFLAACGASSPPEPVDVKSDLVKKVYTVDTYNDGLFNFPLTDVVDLETFPMIQVWCQYDDVTIRVWFEVENNSIIGDCSQLGKAVIVIVE